MLAQGMRLKLQSEDGEQVDMVTSQMDRSEYSFAVVNGTEIQLTPIISQLLKSVTGFRTYQEMISGF